MDVTKPPVYQYIDTSAGLETVAKCLESEPMLAVDLEADSMYHFKEKVCLLQMAGTTGNFVIDPLQITDFSPLAPLFADPGIQKVFHGADYDIRSLYRDFDIEVHNLFDTELASRFLGITETGLEAVLLNRFNIRLDKKYQKKNWSQRPLPPEMVSYAARDVVSLISLANQLTAELIQENRLAWVTEECDLLSRVRPANNDGHPLFLKFKGAGRLDPGSLALLELLLQYRKGIAEKKDRPVFKIMGNQTLKTIAIHKPTTIKRLGYIAGMSKTQVGMYGKAIINLTHKAIALPSNELPHYPRQKRTATPAALPERLKVLKEWRDKKADDLGIDPAIVCNKALMHAICLDNPTDDKTIQKIDGLKKWQLNAFGKEILDALTRTGGKKRG